MKKICFGMMALLLTACGQDPKSESQPPQPPAQEEGSSSDAVEKNEEEVRLLGEKLYEENCANCHGNVDNSTKKGRTANQISAAISSIVPMASIQLSDEEIEAIAFVLKEDMNQIEKVGVLSLFIIVLVGVVLSRASSLGLSTHYDNQCTFQFSRGWVRL